MKFIAIIPARYGSTRFPGKPLVNINGKSMVHNVYIQASKVFETVYVATDDERILNEVLSFEGKVVMTKKKHKSGTDRCAEAIEKIEVLENASYDVVINIQGDEPFIKTEQLKEIKAAFKYKRTQIATLIKPINNKDDIFNPNKPKVVINKDNEAIYFSRSPIPFLRGQKDNKWVSKHLFYKHIGLYGYRKDVLLEITKLSCSLLEKAESLEQLRWIENGYKIKVGFTEHESISIDTPRDIEKIRQVGLFIMNIAVNTRLLLKDKLEGIGWFSFESLKRITKNHPEHTFYYMFDRDWDESFITSDNIIPIKAGLPTRHPFLWYLWMEFTIPKVLKKIKADIFVSPDGMISLKTKIPQIPVIHDINFHHNPYQLPFWVRKYNNHFYQKFAKKAAHIGTVSEYSKSDIAKSYNVNPDKISVCYNGSNLAYQPVPDKQKEEIKSRFTEGNDYFVFVGALNPRKNIPGLLKSFDIFKKSGNYSQKLIIVGSAMHLTGEISETLKEMEFDNDVIFTGRLNIEDLSSVVGSAVALVYIPFFEGFGIPLVEAMYAETAIISGDATSLPEVAGEAALMASSNDHKLVAQHMKSLVNDRELRVQMIEKGRIQREKFSWDKTADRFWSCIEKGMKS